jgi:phosphate transport system substrate-binding protein
VGFLFIKAEAHKQEIGPTGRSDSPRWALAVVAVLIAWAMTACGTSLPTPEPVVLTLVTSGNAAPLASDLAAGYQAAYPHVAVRVEIVGGSLAAETRLAQGRAGAAFTTRWPQVAAERPLTATQVAWDAVALIASPDLRLDTISLDQVQRIFSGKLRNWSELDSGSRRIQAAVREDGSGIRGAFDSAVLRGSAITPMALILPGDDQMLDFVAGTPGSIGYAAAAWLSAVSSDESSRVRVLAVEGLAPDPQANPSAGYPLLLPIYAVTANTPDAHVAAFMAWVQSPDGQRVVQQRYGNLR